MDLPKNKTLSLQLSHKLVPKSVPLLGKQNAYADWLEVATIPIRSHTTRKNLHHFIIPVRFGLLMILFN